MMAVIARPVGTIFRLEIQREGAAATRVVSLASAPRPLEPELHPFDAFEKLTGIRLGPELAATSGGAPHLVVVHDQGRRSEPQKGDAVWPRTNAPERERPIEDAPGRDASRRNPLERPAYEVGSRLVAVLPGFGVVLALEEGRNDQEIPIATADDLARALRASTIGTTTTAVLVWWTAGRREHMILSGEARRPAVL
jgi:hypothetical protein